MQAPYECYLNGIVGRFLWGLMDGYVDTHNFMPVYCNATKKTGHICPQYLGYIQTDTEHATVHFCRVCKINHVFVVDRMRGIRRFKLSRYDPIGTPEALAVMT